MADQTLQIVTRARDILQERGWTPRFSAFSVGNHGPVNIRTAVQVAARELTGDDKGSSYREFLGAIQAITAALDSGIQSWEAGGSAGQSRSHNDVVAKMTSIVERLEKGEKPRLSGKRSGSRAEHSDVPPGQQPTAESTGAGELPADVDGGELPGE